MIQEQENKLNRGLDYILDQLSHGNTIGGLKKGRVWMGFEQVKEWRSKFGYQFQIYSNDHFIENKPHFHIVKKSEDIDCRVFFDGIIIDCKGYPNIMLIFSTGYCRLTKLFTCMLKKHK